MYGCRTTPPKHTLHIVNYNLIIIIIIIIATGLGNVLFIIKSSTHRETDESETLDPSGRPVRAPIIAPLSSFPWRKRAICPSTTLNIYFFALFIKNNVILFNDYYIDTIYIRTFPRGEGGKGTICPHCDL